MKIIERMRVKNVILFLVVVTILFSCNEKKDIIQKKTYHRFQLETEEIEKDVVDLRLDIDRSSIAGSVGGNVIDETNNITSESYYYPFSSNNLQKIVDSTRFINGNEYKFINKNWNLILPGKINHCIFNKKTTIIVENQVEKNYRFADFLVINYNKFNKN